MLERCIEVYEMSDVNEKIIRCVLPRLKKKTKKLAVLV